MERRFSLPQGCNSISAEFSQFQQASLRIPVAAALQLKSRLDASAGVGLEGTFSGAANGAFAGARTLPPFAGGPMYPATSVGNSFPNLASVRALGWQRSSALSTVVDTCAVTELMHSIASWHHNLRASAPREVKLVLKSFVGFATHGLRRLARTSRTRGGTSGRELVEGNTPIGHS